MSCAADRGDFPVWAEKTADQREEITTEVDAYELAARLLAYLDNHQLWDMISELEKALDQEYRRGVDEARLAIGAALQYRPISPDETR